MRVVVLEGLFGGGGITHGVNICNAFVFERGSIIRRNISVLSVHKGRRASAERK